MKEIVTWLIKAESMAGEIYREAAQLFKTNPGLAAFLNREAKAEDCHRDTMAMAAEYIQKKNISVSEITLDDETKHKLEAPLYEIKKQLSYGTATEEEVLKWIAAVEFSEWNHIFLYIIDTLKNETVEFQYASAKIQEHLDRVKGFMASLPNCREYLDKIHDLKRIWDEKILVVDDSGPVRNLLKAIFEKESLVKTAADGKQALEKLAKQYYDIIISDIEMPVMDGIELYKKAEEMRPGIWNRFLFFSASPEPYDHFFRANNLRYLPKPSSLKDIRKTVAMMRGGTGA